MFCNFFFPGGCCGSTKKRTIVGGWAWAWWLVTDVQRLSLEVMTLNPMCEMVETAQGVPLTVTGVAQCKIMKEGVGHPKLIPETLEQQNVSSQPWSTIQLVYAVRNKFAIVYGCRDHGNDTVSEGIITLGRTLRNFEQYISSYRSTIHASFWPYHKDLLENAKQYQMNYSQALGCNFRHEFYLYRGPTKSDIALTAVIGMMAITMMNVYYFHHQADELLGTASEQFLGKSVKEIKMTILQTLEGHLRAILGTLTVEEVYKDRDQFAALVREVAAPDVGRMGIEILSFTIKDVYDDVQYLQSLGKAQTASVKRDADAGVAEANRDAGIREAECEKSAMDVKYSTDTKIEDNARMYKLQKANFDQEINTAKAESQLAYELQAAKIRQRIRNEEIQIDIVERRKQIEIETQEINRKDCELSATVKLPAEAESYRVQTIAEGKRTQTVETARAEAERIKKIGAAEAYAIEQVGKAEAERMRMKANVYKMYGDAAIMNIVLESLPKIAAEVAAPLAKTEEIVLIGGNDQTTGDVARLVGQLPPAINALTGVDLSKVLGKIPGAKA
uniref:Band 7 domain-containing protein n=1 Tax=Anopheles minimus TaxID=112268 RepID=A0A182VXW1_9DIPT